MLYEKDVYNSVQSEEDIDDKRLNIIRNIECDGLEDVIEAVLENKKAGYQELLIDEYVDFIKNYEII